MFNREIHGGIPVVPGYLGDMSKWHQLAKYNDKLAKDKMKREYDDRMRVKECKLETGDCVLVRREKKCKSMSIWDPDPYIVKETRGSMVIATRHNHTITRNSSFFKAINMYGEDEDDHATESMPTSTPSSGTGNTLEIQQTKDAGGAIVEEGVDGVAKRKPGRPTTADSAAIKKERELDQKTRTEANPPTRKSRRNK